MKYINTKDSKILGLAAICVCLIVLFSANLAAAAYTCDSRCSMTNCDTGRRCAPGTMNCDGYGDCSDTDDGGAYCCSLGCNPFGNCDGPRSSSVPNLSASCSAVPSSGNVGDAITWSASAFGGNGYYTYSWTGTDGLIGSQLSVSKSYLVAGSKTATVTVTSGSQSATAICSVSVNQNCLQYYQQRCNGSNLYWYDSCGNSQSIAQYCSCGCSGNSCQACSYSNNYYAPACTYHSYQRCYGNNLYWYDSCGNLQDIVQYCTNGCSGNACQNYSYTYNNASLSATETVKNLTTGSGFASSVSASPSDMLMFMITLRASGQDAQYVAVKDVLPSNLIYNGQLTIACAGANSSTCANNYNNSGNITSSGINIGTIYNGQTMTITYRAQVASAEAFSYGINTLRNVLTVTATNTGYIPAISASIAVTRGAVLGASTVSTGLTNNIWLDSFILPLLVALIGIWMWKSGMFFWLEKWLDGRKKIRYGYRSEKELSSRIENIRKFGK